MSAATQLAFDAGHAVGDVARALFPAGELIEPPGGLQAALRVTRERLAARRRHALFEATFEHGGVLTRADLLLPEDRGWSLAEVKSSGSVRGYHHEDIAIQRWVCAGAGVPLARIELWCVDTSWVYTGDGDYRGLFARHDMADVSAAHQSDVPRWIQAAQDTLAGGEPAIGMGEQCSTPFVCPFQAHCLSQAGPQPEYPVTLLPNNKGKKLANQLLADGYADLRDVPPERFSEPEHALIARVTRDGAPWIGPDAAGAVSALPWPRAYLDFETIGFAVPRWAGTRPYQQVPFQWSCRLEQPDGRLEPLEFLDLSGHDPRRACAEALVRDLPMSGAVVTYNASFERGVLTGLAAYCSALSPPRPELAAAMTDLAARIADLLPIVRAHYYHRDMRGSRSIKSVLPTLGAGLDYDDLDEVQDGTAAQAAYLEATAQQTTPQRRDALRRNLLRYCALDAQAMVELARFLGAPR